MNCFSLILKPKLGKELEGGKELGVILLALVLKKAFPRGTILPFALELEHALASGCGHIWSGPCAGVTTITTFAR